MKKLVLAALIVIFTGILSSCTKKHNNGVDALAFSSKIFTTATSLATAD
jgi:hypothetical protein